MNGIVNDANLITAYDYPAYRQYLVDKKPKEVASFDAVHGAGYQGTIYDSSNMNKLLYSAGAGLKLAMNQNFVISAEFAKCFTPGLDAGLWIGIGVNYQF